MENSRPGGVVLREIEVDVPEDDMEQSWRDGYYLYYELTGNGGKCQQIFVRGTSNRADFWVDLRTTKAWDDECGCYLHSGFAERAELLLKDLEPLLDKDARLTLSGHSLGGAVATIVAMKLTHRGYHVDRVVTFGGTTETNPLLHLDVLYAPAPINISS